MSPKDQAIFDAIATIEKALSKTLGATLPKVVGDVFDAGGVEYAAALQRAMQSVNPMREVSRSIIGSAGLPPVSAKATGKTGKDGRVPRGSIRRAILTVLLPKPEGLTASEVVARAQEIDPSISISGIHNELKRQKGMIYLNEDGRWRVPSELTLGGDYYDLNDLRNPERDRATEP